MGGHPRKLAGARKDSTQSLRRSSAPPTPPCTSSLQLEGSMREYIPFPLGHSVLSLVIASLGTHTTPEWVSEPWCLRTVGSIRRWAADPAAASTAPPAWCQRREVGCKTSRCLTPVWEMPRKGKSVETESWCWAGPCSGDDGKGHEGPCSVDGHALQPGDGDGHTTREVS